MTPRAHETSRPTPSLYFVNASVDWLCIGLGSILTFGLVWALGNHLNEATVRSALIYGLIFLGNAPHFAATNYRLYRSRETIRQFPITALVVPIVIFFGIVASLVWPAWIAPCFVKLYVLWSPYHYSGQSVGVSLVYARRGEFVLGRVERALLSLFIYGTFVTSTAYAETGKMPIDYFGIAFPALGFPPLLAQLAECGTYLAGIVFLALVLFRSYRRRKLFPLILLLPAATQFTWFLMGPRLPTFFQLVPFFHGLQYLLIAWFLQMRERMAERGRIPILFESAWWGIANILGGVFLFWALPRLLASALGFNAFLTLPLALAGMQIHHFFVDGVIWKLRHPKLGAALLGGLRSLTESTRSRRLAA